MKLSDVSGTAIATLRCHVLESKKTKPILDDPMSEYFLNRLISIASDQNEAAKLSKKLSPVLSNHIAIRARKYDNIVNDFVAENPNSIVINLGCGFDTRFWRIHNQGCKFYDLDLPEVIGLKREILKEKLEYELIACSVLNTSWIDRILSEKNRRVLLLAEGLFMYLNKSDVIGLFKTFAERFLNSQITLEVVTEKYTRGFWKRIVSYKIKRELGLDAGSSYNFGIKNAKELESFAHGIKVTNEWSYTEDPDIRPRILKYMGLPKTQWTVTATLNAKS